MQILQEMAVLKHAFHLDPRQNIFRHQLNLNFSYLQTHLIKSSHSIKASSLLAFPQLSFKAQHPNITHESGIIFFFF